MSQRVTVVYDSDTSVKVVIGVYTNHRKALQVASKIGGYQSQFVLDEPTPEAIDPERDVWEQRGQVQ